MTKKINLDQFDRQILNGFLSNEDADISANGKTKSKELRRQIVIENIDLLPALPGFISQIIHLTENAASKAEDFIPLFSDCQDIVTKMLALANTSFYGLDKKVTSIPEAINLLGHKTLRSLAYTALAKTAYENSAKEYGYTPTGLWQHSVAVAGVARRLARNFGFSAEIGEELFVAGLMHDVGKIVIGKELAKYADEFLMFMENNKLPVDVSEMEQAIFAIEHMEVARLLAIRWELHEHIVNAIYFQPTNADVDEDYYNYHCILNLADFLALEARIGLVDNFQWRIGIAGKVLQQLNIDADQLEVIRDEMNIILEDVSLL